jgi:hypothetical protein
LAPPAATKPNPPPPPPGGCGGPTGGATVNRLPRHLSVSSVQLYARCPAQWRRRYLDGIADPPSPPMAFGGVLARALEALHRGRDGDLALAVEHAKAAAELRERGAALRPSAEYGLQLLRLYREHGVYAGTPERRFLLKLPGRPEVPPIMGYLDLECEREVIEFKTSYGRWTQARVDAEFQAAVYGWAFHQLNRRRPECVRYVVLSTRTPGLETFETRPNGTDLLLFEYAAAATWQGIRDGRFDGCGKCRLCAPEDEQSGAELVFGGVK